MTWGSTFEDEVPPEPSQRWRLRSLTETIARQTRWLTPPAPGLIPIRYLTLVAAVGGVGKSHWLIAVGAQGSVAAEPWDTIYVSFEDGAEEVLRPRFEAAGADLSRIHELVLANGDLTEFSLPRDVDDLRMLVRASGAKLVVVDPVVASIETRLDAYKDQHVRQVLAQLWHMAKDEDCAVAIVGHLNRVPSVEAYLRIANSMAFWNASRSVVLLTYDGDERDGVRLVAQRKANLARLSAIERHVLEEVVLPETFDPETGNRIVTSRLRFVEIADDVNPADVLGSHRTSSYDGRGRHGDVLAHDGRRSLGPCERDDAVVGRRRRDSRLAARGGLR